MKIQPVHLSLCIWLVASVVSADDFTTAKLYNWHQWRGPLASGVAPYGDPPIEWDEQHNIKWKTRISGEGSSTPIVWDNQVFVLSAEKTDRRADEPARPDASAKTQPPEHFYRFLVFCLDRQTGKVRWRRIAQEAVPHEGLHSSHTYAAASPTTDGRNVYASFGSRGIYCYDLNGNLQWSRDFGDMRTRYGWGEAVTPVVHGDRLIVNWDQEDDSFIVALDAQTGATKWKVDRDEPSGWATPLVVDHDGRTQVIVNGTNRVRSYDLATGDVIWQCGGQTINAIPSPVVMGDLVVCMSGYRGHAAYAIPLNAAGDVTDSSSIMWSFQRGTPYVPSPIIYQDRIYFTRANSAILWSLNVITGELVIAGKRLPDLRNLYASPSGAADRIYFVDRDGTTVVINHADDLEVLSVNKLDDSIDASPVIVGKELLLRGRQYLYCVSATP